MIPLVLLLSAAPVQVAEPLPPAPTTHAIVSTYPLALAGATLVLATTDGNAGVYVPLSVQVPIRSDLSIDVDVAFGWHTPTSFGSGFAGWSVTLAAGPTWFPFSGERVLGGFYVGPRFELMVLEPAKKVFFFAAAEGGGPLDAGPGVRRSFLVGGEIGWQFRAGRWTFGPVLGASVGYSFDATSGLALPFETGVANFRTQRNDGFALGFNLNVFKLGCAF